MRPPHPAFNVRDDRETPLLIERGTRVRDTDFGKNESGKFFMEGLDGWNRVEGVSEISFLARVIFRVSRGFVADDVGQN
jgi:hypothetical protein